MDLSWAAVILLPSIVTPALLLYFLFRLIVPKAKSPQQNDFISILLFSLLVTVINLQLLGFTINLIAKAQYYDGIRISNSFELYRSLIGRNSFDPIRPFVFFYRIFCNDFLPTNILGIFLDLHIRPILIAIGLYLAKIILKSIKEIAEVRFYDSSWIKKADILISKLTNPFKKYFFSYWNYVLDFNPNLEIIILDISTEDGNLYTGRFVDWTPDDSSSSDTIGSLGIKDVFKYAPPEKIELKSYEVTGHFSAPKSKRDWRLINNKGTMYIPYSFTRTIHIWKLHRGAIINIWVNDFSSNERMKWYLLLVGSRPNFIGEIVINVNVRSDDEQDSYLENFENFIIENGIENLVDIIDLNIFVRPNS